MNFIIENFKKPKTILIVLGLTAIIVFSVMLVGYESYLSTLIVQCYTDADCQSGYKCQSGRCVSATPITTCTDPDGENLFVKGTTKQITGNYTSTYYDQCQNGKVHEWYCQGNQAEVKNISCPSGYSCVNLTDGKCTKETPTCSPELTLCGRRCVNLNSDFYNCGSCGNKCSFGYKCQSGRCVKLLQCSTDDDCSSGYKCQSGRCVKQVAKADLIVQDISWTPASPKVGDNVKFKVSIKNIGGTTAYYPPTKIKISSIGYEKVKTGLKINAGQTVIYDFTAYPAKFSSSGSYSVVAIADYINNTTELNENNNKKTETVSVSSIPATCEADGKCKSSGCPNGDPDCACAEQSGIICQTDEICSGTSLSHSGTGTCCSVVCTPAAIYSISGQITSSEDISLSNIAINLTGTSLTSTTTDSSGNYSFGSLINGSYTITPLKSDYIFSPVSQNTTISSSNSGNINFNAISKECNSGETKNHTCSDGTEVDWCSCDNYKWACIDSPEVNCPATCEADGKCKTFGCPTGDPDCSCSEYEPSGFICQANETCPGISLTHSGSGICCSVACEGNVVYQTADFNCDGNVNAGDMAILLSWWGNPSGFTCCQNPDIDSDGSVNAGDFSIILRQWTFDTF